MPRLDRFSDSRWRKMEALPCYVEFLDICEGARLALTFDSIAVFDPASQGIKFAGRHVDPTGAERFVICLVSSEALRARFQLEDPSPEQLLAAYSEIKNDIHRAAAKQFAAGEKRPSISAQDLL
jgi:hypothetical protein